MNYSDESSNRKISALFSSIGQYQLQKEYDTTLSLYEGEASTPIGSHHAKGSIRVSLWKVLAIFGACLLLPLFLRGILSICSLFSD